MIVLLLVAPAGVVGGVVLAGWLDLPFGLLALSLAVLAVAVASAQENRR